MTRQTSMRMMAVLVIAGAVAMGPKLLHGQDKSVPDDDNTLTAELNAELSDVETEDELVDAGKVEEQIDKDLHNSKLIDYDALETLMEEDGTTVEKVVHHAVEEAEADGGEQLSFYQAGKQVNGKAVADHTVADLRGHADHQRAPKTFSLPGMSFDATFHADETGAA